jgi:protein-arginine kinase activator protein McsA
MGLSRCQNCHNDPAEVVFTWPVTGGVQKAKLCNFCASAWWSKYANTPSGLGLQIEPEAANPHKQTP